MVFRGKERRKYERYDLETKVHFYVTYNLKTKVSFRVIDGGKCAAIAKKYFGLTRNISAEGIRFASVANLRKGDKLFLEVYLPGMEKPIPMTGQVRWSRQIVPVRKDRCKFDTGVKILTVKNKRVAPTIHFEEHRLVHWSIVLDTVFGEFHKFLHKKKRLPVSTRKRISLQ